MVNSGIFIVTSLAGQVPCQSGPSHSPEPDFLKISSEVLEVKTSALLEWSPGFFCSFYHIDLAFFSWSFLHLLLCQILKWNHGSKINAQPFLFSLLGNTAFIYAVQLLWRNLSNSIELHALSWFQLRVSNCLSCSLGFSNIVAKTLLAPLDNLISQAQKLNYHSFS